MRLRLVIIIVFINGSFSDGGTKRGNSQESSIEYFTRPNSRITIPIKIHFDRSLTHRLTKEYKIKNRKLLKDISKTIIKEVEYYFKHSSLNQSIHFNLIDTKFITKRLENDENGSTYLKNYCTRQGAKKKASKKWWYSVLITGLNLFYLDGNGIKVRSSTGRGYMSGVCALEKSCTLLEWNSKNIGYLLTHEIGHSLGMKHDGRPHNECQPYRNIMSNKYNPRYPPRTWSRCSKRDLQRFLGSSSAWCIR